MTHAFMIASFVVSCLGCEISGKNHLPIRSIEYGEKINSINFHPLSKRIVVGDQGRTVRIIDLATEKVSVMMDHQWGVSSVAFSPRGKMVASGGWDGHIKLWNTQTGKLIRTLSGHRHSIRCVTFSASGDLIATGSYDATLKIWNCRTGTLRKTIQRRSRSIRSVEFSKDGKELIAKYSEKSIGIWNVATGKLVATLQDTKPVLSLALSPNGTTLAVGSFEGVINLWDIEKRKKIRLLKGHSRQINSLCFRSDGLLLGSGSDDETARFWRVEDGKQLFMIRHTDRVTSVTFSPDQNAVISGCWDRAIRYLRLK